MRRHRYGASRPPRAAVLLLLPAVVLLALLAGTSPGPAAASSAASVRVQGPAVARPALPQPGRSRRAGLPVAVAVVALIGSATLLARTVRADRERALRDRATSVARSRRPQL